MAYTTCISLPRDFFFVWSLAPFSHQKKIERRKDIIDDENVVYIFCDRLDYISEVAKIELHSMQKNYNIPNLRSMHQCRA